LYPLPKLGQMLAIEDFKPFEGEAFVVDATPEPIRIKLDEAQAMPGPDWMEREPFTLLFSTPWDTLLVEGNYRMKSPRGDLVEVYIIPTQTAFGPRRSYHAVFN
jgi:hypothetical protein